VSIEATGKEVNNMAGKTYTLSQVSAKAAELSGQDATVCGKKIRARIRSNFGDLAEEWTGLAEAKENRDGNRYPPMPAGVASTLLKPFRTSTKDEADDEDEE
jgi:hypothetical protein